jgi:PPK2 family polyphosphate:nucleotide phosphotransferase
MKLAKIVKACRIDKPGRFRLADHDPAETFGLSTEADNVKPILADGIRRLAEMQQRLYANGRWAVLIVLQGMDAAGKDGVIKHVMSGVNPQGCEVHPFKQPSPLELDHDFLWRAVVALPKRGHIGIFNRSYYEEVLIARVHPDILKAENLPESDGKKIWEHRFDAIRGLESHLHNSGTRIVKFFLHISKEEQRKRFLARIDDPDKNWKFNAADVEERGYWKDYMHAYGEAIAATSTKQNPWYIVPADDKRNARLIVSEIVVGLLNGLDLGYPPTGPERRRELQAIRRRLST